MMTKLKRLPEGFQRAATENRFKFKRNFRNDKQEFTGPLLLKAIFKGNSIQLQSTILKVDCLNYVLFPLFSLRGAAVRRPRFSNKANDAFLAAAEKQTHPSRNDEKMRKANIYVLQKKLVPVRNYIVLPAVPVKKHIFC